MEGKPSLKEESSEERKLSAREYLIGRSIKLDIIGDKDNSYEANYKALSEFSAELLADTIKRLNKDETKQRIVLGLAADTSPVGMYKEFARIREEQKIDLSKIFIVRYEQGYGPDVVRGGDFDFDAFHEQMFFEANDIEPRPAEIIQTPEGQKVEGNFLAMFKEYKGDEDKAKIEEVVERFENVLKILGNIDFAVMGLGKDGHIIDWGRFEKGFQIRKTREKTPEEYDKNYKRFEGEESYRNYMWSDILKLGEEITGKQKEEVEEGLKTTATLGIGHIIKADEVVIIAPQETKDEAVKEAVYGSVSGDIIDLKTGNKIGSLLRDKSLRNPAASVISVRNILNKKTRLVVTPESARKLSL
jgi:6-phosphogluconolactonase/glucosamine-6-phosphate isomerase/deaminase